MTGGMLTQMTVESRGRNVVDLAMESVVSSVDSSTESAVIGAIILGDEYQDDRKAIHTVLETVPPDLMVAHVEALEGATPAMELLFSDSRNNYIFGAAISLAERSAPIQLQTLVAELAGHKALEAAGGATYIISTEDHVWSISQLPELLKVLLRHREERAIAKATHRLSSRLTGGSMDAADAVDLFRREVDAIKSCRARLNQPMGLGQFLASRREKLNYHIEGLLPDQGKMLITAGAKAGKTLILENLGMALASGDNEFLGFRFGEPIPVLMIQPELSDALHVERLNWMKHQAPYWMDLERVERNFHVLETSNGRPCLWHEHPRCATSRREVTSAIERTGARVLLCDSLYMLFAGVEESRTETMTLALDYLGSLANSYGVAIILTHHHGKTGVSRGSSVLQGWPESDLSMAPVSGDDGVWRCDALLRCSFSDRFPAHWRRPKGCAWFELIEGYEPPPDSGRGRPKDSDSQLVAYLLSQSGRSGMNNKDLSKLIMDARGVCERTAQTRIREAVGEGVIVKYGNIYGLAKQVTK